MKPLSIALNIIVKDSEEHLARTLESASFVGFDEVVIVDTGSTDHTPDVARRYATTFREYHNYEPVYVDGRPFLSDFAAARDYARILSNSDYIFYLDADDIIFNPLGLREFLNENIRTGRFDGVRMTYDYLHDSGGRCTMSHETVRCAHKISHVWRSPIHEVLCAMFEPSKCVCPSELSRVVHEAVDGSERRRHCDLRNAAVAERYMEKLGEDNVELRLWYHYGRSLFGLEKYDESLRALNRFIDGPPAPMECYEALLFVCEIHRRLQQYGEATRRGHEAAAITPATKDAWLDLAKTSMRAGDFGKSLAYLEIMDAAEGFSPYKTFPLSQAAGADEVRAYDFMGLYQFREAIEAIDRVLEIDPNNRDLLVQKVVASKALRHDELSDAYKKVEFVLAKEGDPLRVRTLRSVLPRALENEPEFARPVEVADSRPRVVFFVGDAHEVWGPKSHLEGGIGGSETAVIHMSRELAKLGWAPEIYGLPPSGEEGLHDGVNWLPYWRYEGSSPPEVLVAWRNQALIPRARADLKYVWLHDVQYQNRWHQDYWQNSTAIIVLSEYHRRGCPWIPSEKIWISANGIDDAWHVDGENHPHRLIYASGPDRGLNLLLRLWPRIRESVPDAHLDVFYGFTPLFMETVRSNPIYKKIYDEVVEGIRQDGVTWHGRVGQADLAHRFANSGIWAYPTSFPEISCITAMQAQATGAIPVTTGYAALSETVQYGRLVGGVAGRPDDDPRLAEEWLSTLVDLLGDPATQDEIRKEMVPWARTNFSWAKVAAEWSRRFQKDSSRPLNLPAPSESSTLVEV